MFAPVPAAEVEHAHLGAASETHPATAAVSAAERARASDGSRRASQSALNPPISRDTRLSTVSILLAASSHVGSLSRTLAGAGRQPLTNARVVVQHARQGPRERLHVARRHEQIPAVAAHELGNRAGRRARRPAGRAPAPRRRPFRSLRDVSAARTHRPRRSNGGSVDGGRLAGKARSARRDSASRASARSVSGHRRIAVRGCRRTSTASGGRWIEASAWNSTS